MGVGVGRQNEADPCPIKNNRRQTATAREVPNPGIFDHCFAESLLQGKRPSALNPVEMSKDVTPFKGDPNRTMYNGVLPL